MSALDDYFSALERLKKNQPVRLPKHSKISKDTVALEAGRKRGSIKKSRVIFSELIAEIEYVSNQQEKLNPNQKMVIEKYKSERDHYRDLYHDSLNRELMLINRVNDLEKQLKPKVIPIRSI